MAKSFKSGTVYHHLQICELLKKHLPASSSRLLLGDLLDAAGSGKEELLAFVDRHSPSVTQRWLQEGLENAIRNQRFTAATTLLQYGVDPDGRELFIAPLRTALEKHDLGFVDLLLAYGANPVKPGLLSMAVFLYPRIPRATLEDVPPGPGSDRDT